MKKRKELPIEDKIILQRIEDDFSTDVDKSREYRDNRKTWDEMIRSLEVKKAGQSFNVKLPLVRIARKILKSRIMQLLKKRRTFKPTEECDSSKVIKSEEFFDWIRTTHLSDEYFNFLDLGTTVCMDEGTVISRVLWKRKEQKRVDYQYFDFYVMDEMTGQPREISTDELIRGILPQKNVNEETIVVHEIGEDRVKVKYQVHRKAEATNIKQWEDKECEIDFSLDEGPVKEAGGTGIPRIVAKVERPSYTIFEGADLRLENFDSVAFHPDSKDLQETDHIIIRFQVPYSTLLEKRAQGIYRFSNEEGSRIKDTADDNRPVQEDTSEIEEKINEGTSTEEEWPQNAIMVEGYEAYYLWDVDGKGFLDQVLFTVIPKANLVIRKSYLSEAFRHGKRPFQAGIWELRKYRYLGIGLPEEMEVLGNLINDVFNLVLNAAQFAIDPPILYDPVKAATNQEFTYTHGQAIPLRADAVTIIPSLGNFPVGFEILKLLLDLFNKESTASDQVQGSSGGVKTATATMKLLQESYANMSLNIERIVQWVKEVDTQIWQMYLAYMPDNMKYRVSGAGNEWIFNEVTVDDLLLNPDITLEIDVAEISREYLQEVAREVFAQIANNPVMIQAGLVTPQKMYNAAKDYLQQLGKKDHQNYVLEPPDLESIPPEKENYMIIQGDNVSTMPLDEDATHIQEHMRFLQDPEEIKKIPPDKFDLVRQRVADHIALHQMQMQQKMRAQQMAIQQAAIAAEQANVEGKDGKKPDNQGKVIGANVPGNESQFLGVQMPGMGAI